MDTQPVRVLYLDDSNAALEAMEAALDHQLYNLRTAATLGEALPWVIRSDIVIVDFHMPGINGSEAVARMRERVGDPPAVFYLYTTDTTIALNFRAHGFDGAFTDKGNTKTLVAKLATAVRLLKMSRLRVTRPAT
jgi:CheY-like chemotaxis protein